MYILTLYPVIFQGQYTSEARISLVFTGDDQALLINVGPYCHTRYIVNNPNNNDEHRHHQHQTIPGR